MKRARLRSARRAATLPINVSDLSLHLAPNAPWIWLLLLSLVLGGVGLWAYRFAVPPVPALFRRLLSGMRIVALLLLLWLLAQPVLQIAVGQGSPRIIALVDRSASMRLPVVEGGISREAAAETALDHLRSAWRGRANIEPIGFARDLQGDSVEAGAESATGLGAALRSLSRTPAGRDANGIVVISDGAVNSGDDPVRIASGLGIPIHTIVVGEPSVADRTVTEVEGSVTARVGEETPVRARVTSTEDAGVPMTLRLMDGTRELDRATLLSPGPGAETEATFGVTPVRPGLAVWSAVLDSMDGEITTDNNARQVAVEVTPGRLGVLIVSAGLNWDLSFTRRALLGDSSLQVTTLTRERSGWRNVDRRRAESAPGPASLRGQSVVILDAIPPAAVSPEFDAALARFVRDGGGLMILGGPLPGLSRFRAGVLGEELQINIGAGVTRSAAPQPTPEGHELTAWDDDPARGERAWRSAAPVSELVAVEPGIADRALIGVLGGGPPIVFSRRIGRGQALFVNGTGLWRWALSPHDELSGERGKRLWRRLARWLAEPVQGEPLRARPERWLTSSGETVRIFATLQDQAFRSVSGAEVQGELRGGSNAPRRVTLKPGAAGSYVAELDGLPPGRYRIDVRAQQNGQPLGRSGTDFAVDSWSLEAARSQPDSITLAAVAQASGGRITPVANVSRWAGGIETGSLARARTSSLRLWESPWVFAIVVGMLAFEWAWRRRRGLP